MTQTQQSAGRARWVLVGLILALAAARLAQMWLLQHELQQTAALFVGLPTLIAVIITLTARPASLIGMIVTGITIAIVLSALVLGEGIVCLIMAAPLLYLIGILAGWATNLARDAWLRRTARRRQIYSFLLLPLFLVLSLEGVFPTFALGRHNTVSVTHVVMASPAQVTAALAAAPRFEQPLPRFLRLRFPAPYHAQGYGSGLAVGSQRTIPFAVNERPMGELVLVVRETRPGYVQFMPLRDSTPLANWLAWEKSEVTWQGQADGSTQVTWTLHYRRLLDPAWYFAPLERYGVYLATGYLIDTLATP